MTRGTPVPSRTRALARLGALDGLPAPELRRVARLAAHLATQPYGLPMAAVHLLDDRFQHRVASAGGPPLGRTPVRDSMCLLVVEGQRSVYCADASRDGRYAGNPNVSGPSPVRLYYATPLRMSTGETVGALCVFDTRCGTLDGAQRARLGDLADQTMAYLESLAAARELGHLATHDPLTDVANRSLLAHRLNAALADDSRAPHEPALLVVDLDDFKSVNDRYGHGVGDQVLAGTALRLLGSVRAEDLVARLGGDEFAVLFTSVPSVEALRARVERVAAACSMPYATDAGAVVCAASVGLTLGQPGDTALSLLGRADAAMYARKSARPSVPAPRGAEPVVLP